MDEITRNDKLMPQVRTLLDSEEDRASGELSKVQQSILDERKEEKPWYIYGLTDPRTGEVRYIGQTVCNIRKRLYAHLVESRRGDISHKCNWIRSLLSEGIRPGVVEIERGSGDGINEAEIKWISFYRESGLKLVNQADGGHTNKGFKHTPETRALLSVKSRNISIETRKRMSESQKKRVFSEEHRRKLSEANRRRPRKPHTQESRRKMSEKLKGRRFSQTHKENLSKSLTGHKLSPETINKIQETKRLNGTVKPNYTPTEETKRKIIETRRRNAKIRGRW